MKQLPEIYSVAGIRLAKITAPELVSYVSSTLAAAHRPGAQLTVIGHFNLHGLYLNYKNAKMNSFYLNCDFAFADGMPLIWLAKLRGLPFRRSHRLTSLDWIDLLLAQMTSDGKKVFFLGSSAQGNEKLLGLLRCRYPNIAVDGYHGYLNAGNELGNALERIRQFQPDVLLVCMGMPLQEEWILDHANQLPGGVVISLGGLIEYLIGNVSTPPRILGRLGLEWLYRLVTEPKRLWRRYLWEPLALIWILLLRKR